MREFRRTTRECSFLEFPPEIVLAIRRYIEKNELDDVESRVLMCAETVSDKIRQGFFSKILDGANYAKKTAIVLTPEGILWCTLDNKNQTTVLSALLTEIEIKDFSAELLEDHGLDVFGFINRSPERVQAFIGLGEDSAAQKLRQKIKEAVSNLSRK